MRHLKTRIGITYETNVLLFLNDLDVSMACHVHAPLAQTHVALMLSLGFATFQECSRFSPQCTCDCVMSNLWIAVVVVGSMHPTPLGTRTVPVVSLRSLQRLHSPLIRASVDLPAIFLAESRAK